MQIEKRRLKKPSLFDFLHESAGGRAAPMALHGAKGEILSRENGPLVPPREHKGQGPSSFLPGV